MEKYSLLKRIQILYTENNLNIMNFLKSEYNKKSNDISDILISYDFQAGTYVKAFYENKMLYIDYLRRLANILNTLDNKCKSILECGTGEGTTLVPLMEMTDHIFNTVKGCDISWSRIKYACEFAKNYGVKNNYEFVVGDMFNLPCADNSYDIVFTCHAIEPNEGKEKKILRELYRVANRYLILLEPAYELANNQCRKAMDEKGYIKNLYSSAKQLGYKIVTWELYGKNMNELNPSCLMIIEKEDNESALGEWSCPVTKSRLKKYPDAYFALDSLLAYPILGEIPLLTKDHAIVATKYMDFNGRKSFSDCITSSFI